MDLTQFTTETKDGIQVNGEYEGNADTGRVLIFSHGFGVTRNSHGMFDELGDLVKEEMLVVRFDYTKIIDDKTRFLYPYSIQKEMLATVLLFVRGTFDLNEVNLLGHSMGGIIIGLLSPDDVAKTVLVASPIFSPYDRMKNYFSKRKGTVINENGESSIARSDGSVSNLDKNFWPEMQAVDPLALYKEMALKTKLTFVRALDDQVITDGDYKSIKADKNIDYIELSGDHDFSGKDRKGWLDKMVNIIK